MYVIQRFIHTKILHFALFVQQLTRGLWPLSKTFSHDTYAHCDVNIDISAGFL